MTAPDVRELATDLRRVPWLLLRRLRDEAGTDELTWSQTTALARIDLDGPMSVSELARAEGVRSQSMSATVGVLDSRGLVTGAPDPDDGRRTVLHVTDAGRALREAQRTRRGDWLAGALESFDPAERATIAAALPLLRRLAEHAD